MPLEHQMVSWHAWTCLEVLKETVDALVFLHDHRIIHGDLKVGRQAHAAKPVELCS